MNMTQLIKTIYDDCTCPSAYVRQRSIHGDADDYKQMFEGMLQVGQYNGFFPAKVVAALKKHIKGICEITFGREYSPVLYIMPAKVEKNGVDVLIKMLKILGADECWEVNPETHEIRAWWD
jgi:hypothetical protein